VLAIILARRLQERGATGVAYSDADRAKEGDGLQVVSVDAGPTIAKVCSTCWIIAILRRRR